MPFMHLRHEFVDPQCVFGPRALCDALLPLIDACDAGSADDCVALADYLADNPPRQLISMVVYIRACQLGDQTSCARVAEIKKPTNEPCDKDPFGCEWRAYRGGSASLEQTEQACTLGAAESCMQLATRTTDKAAAQAYIETSCQLGNPIACMTLAKALHVGCVPDETQPWCFPPDEAERREAQAMACDAGWLTGSDCN